MMTLIRPEYNILELAGHNSLATKKIGRARSFSVGQWLFGFGNMLSSPISSYYSLSPSNVHGLKDHSRDKQKRKQLVYMQSKSSPLVGSTACLGQIQYGVAHDEEESVICQTTTFPPHQTACKQAKVNTPGLWECFNVCCQLDWPPVNVVPQKIKAAGHKTNLHRTLSGVRR